jgi:hypothetical protein
LALAISLSCLPMSPSRASARTVSESNCGRGVVRKKEGAHRPGAAAREYCKNDKFLAIKFRYQVGPRFANDFKGLRGWNFGNSMLQCGK